MSALLAMHKVSKVYGDGASRVQALDRIDLEVSAGELVAVMGPSGSGKSSLLTVAGSLEDATSGTVAVDGAPLGTMSHKDRARLRRRTIGFVFQEFNLLAGLTAVENVAMPLELDGTKARDARTSALEALEVLDLTTRADAFPDDLSGGERQRVAIARAIVGDRRLLLADEPTGALDTVNGEGVLRLLRKITRRGAAAILVTHDAQLASWADRVVFLRDGRIIDETAPAPGPETLLAGAPSPPR
ncbi:MAG TPA: ABC transporter ATP-binding protein [Acidimicrobiales bacterium]|jgi:putative ABC transport system ATP-binding protein|nr:ABC transporter ATP-binding protein [Acidimicrobiales bacterium]